MLRRIRRALVVLCGALLVAGLSGPGTAAAEEPGDVSPLGANNWSCKPSAAHPEPVVLVHGLSANMQLNWVTLSPLLASRGYCVFALTYGRWPGTPYPLNQVGGLVPMDRSAVELGAFIDRVLAATGAAKVDIVGHSEGSLMPNYYVKFLGGAAKVDDYIGMTPLWQGTNVAGLADLNRFGSTLGADPIVRKLLDEQCGSCRQFLKGSDFLIKMNSGGTPAVVGVTYTNIMTRYDESVVPYTSGRMPPAPNVTNVVIQDVCALDLSEHALVAVSSTNAQIVLHALDPAHARKPRCGLP